MSKIWLLFSVSAFGALLVGITLDWLTALLGFFVLGMMVILFFLLRKSYIVVPEMQVAVVCNRELQAFSRFLPMGRHLLVPWFEQVENHIPVSTQAAKGVCDGRTRDGHRIQVSWMVIYRLSPFDIVPERRRDMARTMPHSSSAMVDTNTNDCLRELIEAYQLDTLLSTGLQNRIKRLLQRLVADRLKNFGYQVYRIALTGIDLPPEVAENLQLQHLLNIVMQTTGDLDSAAMERLNQLRPVLVKGKNSRTSLVYGVIEGDGESLTENAGDNGRSREKFFSLPLAQ